MSDLINSLNLVVLVVLVVVVVVVVAVVVVAVVVLGAWKLAVNGLGRLCLCAPSQLRHLIHPASLCLTGDVKTWLE